MPSMSVDTTNVDPKVLDSNVLALVVQAIEQAAERYGVQIDYVYSQEASVDQSVFPGRNFTVRSVTPYVVTRGWTVWLDHRNPLLNADSLRREAERHVLALSQLQEQ